MWNSIGRSGYGNTNLDDTYDGLTGISANGRQYRNEATLEQRDLSGWAYWNLRKQLTPENEIPESMHAKNDTVNLAHTLPNGKANLLAYADPIITKKPTKVPLKNRILPQASRVEKLHAEILELESAYKAGEFNLTDYSLYRDVAFKKLRRAEELLQRAIKPIEKSDETDEDEVISTYSGSFTNEDVSVYPSEESEVCGSKFFESVIDELSDTNSLKNILKKACKVVRTIRYYSQQAAAYYRTLKEV